MAKFKDMFEKFNTDDVFGKDVKVLWNKKTDEILDPVNGKVKKFKNKVSMENDIWFNPMKYKNFFLDRTAVYEIGTVKNTGGFTIITIKVDSDKYKK